MLHRLGDWVAHHPWRVVLIWAVIALPLTVVGGEKLTGQVTDDQASFLPASSDSAKATQLARDAFGHVEGVTPVTGLVERADGRALTAADAERVAALARTLPTWRPDWAPIERDAELILGLSDAQRATRVVSAAPGARADRGRIELLEVGFHGNATDPVVQDAFAQLRSHAQDELRADGLRIGFTGGVASELDTARATETLSMVEGLLLMGAIIVLNLIFFRGVLAALVPLLAVTPGRRRRGRADRRRRLAARRAGRRRHAVADPGGADRHRRRLLPLPDLPHARAAAGRRAAQAGRGSRGRQRRRGDRLRRARRDRRLRRRSRWRSSASSRCSARRSRSRSA